MRMNKKAVDKKVDEIFYKLGYGIQFGIMDLGKVDKLIRDVVIAGGNDEEAEGAMKVAIAMYGKN